MSRHFEIRLKPRQLAQARDPRQSSANFPIGHKLEAFTGLGNVFDGNRNAPR
jgi:hypothetical protein